MARFSPCILCLIALLMLAACGTDSREAAAVEEVAGPGEASATPMDDAPKILAFGDSLTAGYGVNLEQSYPAVLQKLLDQNGYKYQVINAGISGDTTTGGLIRLEEALEAGPAIVILALGGNDGLRGLPVANTRANLASMIELSQQAGARVLLAGITLPPNYGPDYIRGFEEMYKDLAAKYNVPLVPFLLEGVALTEGMMQGDGIHPTPAGNQIVAKTVFRHLEPLLKKK